MALSPFPAPTYLSSPFNYSPSYCSLIHPRHSSTTFIHDGQGHSDTVSLLLTPSPQFRLFCSSFRLSSNAIPTRKPSSITL